LNLESYHNVQVEPQHLTLGQLNAIVKYCHTISPSTCPTAAPYADIALYKMDGLGMDTMKNIYDYWKKQNEKPHASQE